MAENLAVKQKPLQTVTKDSARSAENPKPSIDQYFTAASLLFSAVMPDDRGYINVKLYRPGEDASRVSILRHYSKYVDGAVGIQDEVMLGINNERRQLNAEITPEGNLEHEYAGNTVLSDYTQHAVAEFADAVKVPGSRINFQFQRRYLESNGTEWVIKDSSDERFSQPLLQPSATSLLEP